VTSFLMQAVGDPLPKSMWCQRCTKGIGIYADGCVVVRDPDVLDVTGGACANCWYSRNGSQCSFREKGTQVNRIFKGPMVGLPEWKAKVRTKQTPVPVPQVPVPTSTTTSTRKARVAVTENNSTPTPAPAPAPLHPSYVAALSAGSTAAVAANTSSSSAVSGSGTSGTGPSREDKVRVWENRYSGMNLDSLLAAHEHLADWQEDLTTRLIAMNRVVIKKLREKEGS
jgi:hypothetical protein